MVHLHGSVEQRAQRSEEHRKTVALRGTAVAASSTRGSAAPVEVSASEADVIEYCKMGVFLSSNC